MAPYKVILVRHGESVYNQENRFCGWFDSDLSTQGVMEAKNAGQLIKEKKLDFDIVFTSFLKRAIKTTWNVLDVTDRCFVPVEKSWRLNERMYGDLQGKNKAETAEQHGEEQVKIWRRSYDIPPPELATSDSRYPGKEAKYKLLDPSCIPKSECLKDTVERVLPYWFDTVVPTIKSGQNVMIVAHGNSLRALIKHLDNVPNDAILELNIPTGIPLVYELNDDMQPMKHYYLEDEEKVAAATARVAQQGKKK